MTYEYDLELELLIVRLPLRSKGAPRTGHCLGIHINTEGVDSVHAIKGVGSIWAATSTSAGRNRTSGSDEEKTDEHHGRGQALPTEAGSECVCHHGLTRRREQAGGYQADDRGRHAHPPRLALLVRGKRRKLERYPLERTRRLDCPGALEHAPSLVEQALHADIGARGESDRHQAIVRSLHRRGREECDRAE